MNTLCNRLLGALALQMLAVATIALEFGAIVTEDQAALRAAPRISAQKQAVLWQGDLLEVRGERLDFLQVYDHRRERGGYVHASLVRRTPFTAEDAPDLLAVLRFVRDKPGREALGIGLVAAYLESVPAETLNSASGTEALLALGLFADRLAQRASADTPLTPSAELAITEHLAVAARYGVTLISFERDGRMRVCYDGDAFRRALAMPATAEQHALAALALTRGECVDPTLGSRERRAVDEWRAGILDRVDGTELPGYLKNRLLLRRAEVWSGLAFQRARQGEEPAPAAERSLAALTGISKSELTEDDFAVHNNAVMRVNASRWAALPSKLAGLGDHLALDVAAGAPGETCVALKNAKSDTTLTRRCTWGLVWGASATRNREGTAIALAVQLLEGWRELWIFQRDANGWVVDVLPPATTAPEIGYSEFAGWVPGGTHVLVAREARGEGKYRRSYELVRLATLTTERQAADASVLGAFQRWQDPDWKRHTVSLR